MSASEFVKCNQIEELRKNVVKVYRIHQSLAQYIIGQEKPTESSEYTKKSSVYSIEREGENPAEK